MTEAYSKEGAYLMLTAIERSKGHYEVQELDFGRVYRWRPEHTDPKCECGERLNVVAEVACLRCRANPTATITAVPAAGRSEDRTLHPWRYDAGDLKDAGLPC
jgi:hypothetical protein